MDEEFDYRVVARHFYLFSTRLTYSLQVPLNVRIVDIVDEIKAQSYASLDAIEELIKPSKHVSELTLLLINYKLADHFPVCLENQYQRCNAACLNFNAAQLYLTVLLYNERDEVQVYITPRLLYEWNQYNGMCIRSVVFTKLQDGGASCQQSKNVLILHDFYYHPLQLMYIANYLAPFCNVYMPFIHDVLDLNTDYLQSALEYAMTDCLADYVDKTIGENPFIIVAYGASCRLAISIQAVFPVCIKVILLNPIGQFESEIPNVYEQIEKEREIASRWSFCSFKSVTDTVATTTTTICSGDEIQLAKSDKRLKPKYKLTGCVHHAYKYAVPYRTRSVSNSLPDLQLIRMEKQNIATIVPVKISVELCRQSEYLPDNIVFSQDYRCELFYLFNSAATAAYDYHALHVLGAFLGSSTGPFVYPPRFSGSTVQLVAKNIESQFLAILPTLYVFSPFAALAGYRLFYEVFDRRFKYNAKRLLSFAMYESVSLCGGATMFLQGSHDCLVSFRMLQFYHSLECSGKACARTLLGCGHDAFSCALGVLQGLI